MRAVRLAWLILGLTLPAAAQPIEVSRTPYPAVLMARAQAALQAHDVSAARRLYEAAAKQGVAEAATALARTYDPREIRRDGASIAPDPEKAAEWYRRAADMGDPLAPSLLHDLLARN